MSGHLRRLDLLLHRQILRMRAAYQLSLDEFRGLYISDEQIDNFIAALKEPPSTSNPIATTVNEVQSCTVDTLSAAADKMRAELFDRESPASPANRLRNEFQLSYLDFDLLLIAAAPDIDPKYETIYAYLNNDVSRKWPTFDLAIRTLDEDADEIRRALLPEGPVFGSGLAQAVDRPADRIGWLSTPFTALPCVAHYLLGIPQAPAKIDILASQVDRSDLPDTEHLVNLVRQAGNKAPLIVIEGHQGTKTLQLAQSICSDLGKSLRCIDLRSAPSEPFAETIHVATVLQRLYNEGLCLIGTDTLFEPDGSQSTSGRAFTDLLRRIAPGSPTIIIFDAGTRWRQMIGGRPHIVSSLGVPDIVQRIVLWRRTSQSVGCSLSEEDLDALAGRYLLTPTQIEETASAAELTVQLAGSTEPPTVHDFLNAARERSGQSMAGLATKVVSVQTWENLVLPPEVLAWVKQVARAMANRHRVFSQWGMGRSMGVGSGLTTLFAGASGTGKTMTAGVIANDLGQDMYKIDLSGIVSKYIGETEKNLDRIFAAAKESNILLFFDEADALFGKRSEVKDAHDRYANIEVAYLLQKLEDYDGIVILATNLSKNIDAAFARRMHFVVDFPIPGERDRERLWRGMFPPEAPLADDIDFQFLSAQFTFPGGDIKNTALTAAFMAGRGEKIGMKHIVRALARQLIKQGRIPLPTDFKQYYVLIAEE